MSGSEQLATWASFCCCLLVCWLDCAKSEARENHYYHHHHFGAGGWDEKRRRRRANQVAETSQSGECFSLKQWLWRRRRDNDKSCKSVGGFALKPGNSFVFSSSSSSFSFAVRSWQLAVCSLRFTIETDRQTQRLLARPGLAGKQMN